MTHNSRQQEIINTPEAKGARILPTTRGIKVNLTALPHRRLAGNHPSQAAPIGRAENAKFAELKAAAIISPSAVRALQLLQCDSQVAGEDSGLGIVTDFSGLDDTCLTPSDCQMAASRDHLIVAVNAALAVFDKSGWLLLQRNLSNIFSPMIGEAVIFNPKVIYDQFRAQPDGGWVIAACARSEDRRRSWLLLACSETGDPLGNWWVWALDAQLDGATRTGLWAEGLGLALDHNWIYLTANMFGARGQFFHSKLRVLNKKEMQSGGAVRGWDFWELRNVDGSLAFALQPAMNLRPAGTQYLLNATGTISNDQARNSARHLEPCQGQGTGVTLWSVSHNPRHPPTLSRRFIPTAPYQIAPDAAQPLTHTRIETGDTRLSNVIFRHGLLWTTHTIAANWGDAKNSAAIQWFQINPRAGCLMQQGIYGSPHHHYFCPAITVDGEGNLAIIFNRTGDQELPSVRFTGRRTSDEPGSLQASATLQCSSSIGTAVWNTASAACIAPDDSQMWLIGQYAATEFDWATWIGAVQFMPEEQEIDFPDYDDEVLYL